MTGRPPELAILLGIATLVSRRSTCSRLAVGAVIARNGRTISTGYNGAPENAPHCDHTRTDQIGDSACTRAIHAEANAIAFAATHGIGLAGTYLVTTHAPCYGCAMLIANCGIEQVYFRWPYRNGAGIEHLQEQSVYVAGPIDHVFPAWSHDTPEQTRYQNDQFLRAMGVQPDEQA